MTSSLVGSEMCIRDRSRTKPRTSSMSWLLAKNTSRKLTAQRDDGDFPVSYTHLTLPTICSV
eukprot:3113283-Prorocentrum_lima.AAC.1